MKELALLLTLLSLPLFADTSVKVKDGHASGVFYGWSVVTDMWGNARKGVWTLRTDGVLMWGAPDGPLEDFDGRALTAAEKENGTATYVIEGTEFKFKYRDGTDGKGKITYAEDGGIKLIEASALRFNPVMPLKFALAGKFDCTTTVNNAAYGISTTAWKGYSFYANGTFVLESGAGSTCTQIESFDSIEREVTRSYGGEAKSRMGRFEVKGTGLTLKFADGHTENRYIGQMWDVDKDGRVFLLIGRSQFDGAVGVFPGQAAAPVKVVPPEIQTCKAEQFEVRLPAGWKNSSQETKGLVVHTLVPGDASAGLAILAIGLDVDCAARAKGTGTEEDMRKSVAAFVGQKLASGGEMQEFEMDGAGALLIPSTFEREGVKMRADAIYAVKSGRAIFLVALGTIAGAATFEADLISILSAARFAVDATKDASTADFAVKAPKSWTATPATDTGSTTLALVPKGVESEEFFAAIVSQPTEFKSAREKKAVTWLRQQVIDAVPGAGKQGEVEKITVDGEPAVGLTYAGSKADGTVVVMHVYAVIKHGKVALLFMGGKREGVDRHSGAARRTFETLKMKEGK
ncbi:MAG: hypothetical protein FD180_3228 [Planctomycetota bacterium]|nr:MAG: hypothetical protein FD180_3228 [Planctomycetota bacterium]